MFKRIDNSRLASFYGRGAAFPFRLNGRTGGTQVTEGISDAVSVALQYISERWTIREDTGEKTNHIAEAIAHILLTIPTEHDTLPEFGSKLFMMLFEPNTLEFKLISEAYMRFAAARWEKRANVGESGIQFGDNGPLTDEGILPMYAEIEFILNQVKGNLVSPFVSPRQARTQEYPSAQIDTGRHDLTSRYFGKTLAQRDGIWYNRLGNKKYYQKSDDDSYYRTATNDTWLLISWKHYSDIRYWPILAEIFVQDGAEADMPRDILDPCGDPPAGVMLRIPSQKRVLMDFTA